jgi:hypothetical protein
MSMSRVRRWIGTYFTDEDRDSLAEYLVSTLPGSDVDFLIGQFELCPTTGRRHLQFYVELNKGCILSYVKSQLGWSSAHLEKCKGSQAQNIAYCTKQDTREPNSAPIQFGEKHHQGKRSDLDDIKDRLIAGEDLDTISLDHFGSVVRYHKGFATLQPMLAPKRPVAMPTVIVLFGPTGTGKTETAYNHDPDLYRWQPGMEKWWDGYTRQTTVLLDEFRGSFPFSFLLTLLDKYPVTLQVKCATASLQATRFYIAAPEHPVNWYKALSANDKLDQLKRRITTIYHTTPSGHTDVTDRDWSDYLPAADLNLPQFEN